MSTTTTARNKTGKRHNSRAPFAEQIVRFAHPRLAGMPSYARFREALADLVDESDQPLHVVLNAIRAAALSSPFGAPCPGDPTHGSSWPLIGELSHEGRLFTGRYRCDTCRHEFEAAHDIDSVIWPN